MKFTLNWLKKHLETTATPEEISTKLVQLGIEVEAVENQAAAFEKVVIGHVHAREQHPDADKLGVCTVNVGEKTPRQIVCGAPNVRAELTVAVALEGACLPNGMTIKKSKIRGVESNGMICSAKELGLGDDHTGIMELDTKAQPGTPFADTIQADMADTIFDVSITPNRGDALGVYGIARDLAASGLGELLSLPEAKAGDKQPDITVASKSKNCMFFSGIMVEGIQNKPSPQWLQNLLTAAGLRPRNAVVDITNYIMLECGKPIHAYDADRIKGPIVVKEAKGGEAFKGIGGVSITLNTGDIVITDDSGVIGLGGILGGESTAVSEKTTRVYIESAWFDRSRIAKTGQAHQLHTDARHRFERGIDPAITAWAGRKAAQMIAEICGGPEVKISAQQTDGSDADTPTPITFDPHTVEKLGGLKIDGAKVQKHLTALGFHISGSGNSLKITPPTWRTIMETPEDLVEEILRLEGFDNIPAVLPPIPVSPVRSQEPLLELDRKLRRQLVAQGFLETLTYSFISHKQAEFFAKGEALQRLENPIDEATMGTLRPSLLSGLLSAAAGNQARGINCMQLAEVGKVFTQKTETLYTAALLCGKPERHWQGTSQIDMYTAKAELWRLLEALGYNTSMFQLREAAANYLHPGRSTGLWMGKKPVGLFGELHPAILKAFDVKGPAVCFECNVEALPPLRNKNKPLTLSDYQPVQKDMAFLLPEEIPAGDVLATIKKAVDKELLKDVSIFDVYQGDKLKKGQKSLAFSMTLQSEDRTLTDDDIHKAMQAVSEKVCTTFKAELRDG